MGLQHRESDGFASPPHAPARRPRGSPAEAPSHPQLLLSIGAPSLFLNGCDTSFQPPIPVLPTRSGNNDPNLSTGLRPDSLETTDSQTTTTDTSRSGLVEDKSASGSIGLPLRARIPRGFLRPVLLVYVVCGLVSRASHVDRYAERPSLSAASRCHRSGQGLSGWERYNVPMRQPHVGVASHMCSWLLATPPTSRRFSDHPVPIRPNTPLRQGNHPTPPLAALVTKPFKRTG